MESLEKFVKNNSSGRIIIPSKESFEESFREFGENNNLEMPKFRFPEINSYLSSVLKKGNKEFLIGYSKENNQYFFRLKFKNKNKKIVGETISEGFAEKDFKEAYENFANKLIGEGSNISRSHFS